MKFCHFLNFVFTDGVERAALALANRQAYRKSASKKPSTPAPKTPDRTLRSRLSLPKYAESDDDDEEEGYQFKSKGKGKLFKEESSSSVHPRTRLRRRTE